MCLHSNNDVSRQMIACVIIEIVATLYRDDIVVRCYALTIESCDEETCE